MYINNLTKKTFIRYNTIMKVIHTQPLILAGNGIVSGNTSLTFIKNTYLKNLGSISMEDFGDYGVVTLSQGQSNEEEIIFTSLVDNTDTITISNISNIQQKQPFTLTSGVKNTHIGGSTLIFSDGVGLWKQIPTSNDEVVWNKKQTFVLPPSIPDGTNIDNPVSLNQLNNVVVGAIGVATETSDGVVSKSNIDNYISGEGNRLPDSFIVNSELYENPIDFILVSTNTFLVIGSDNNLYIQNIINGKTISTTALSTGTRTQTFSKILNYVSETDILLLSSTNILIKFTGNNTFVNVPFGSGSLSLPQTWCIKAKFGLNNTYLSFVGSKKIWIISFINNVVSASPDLVLRDINGIEGYLYSFDIDFNNSIMYATAISDATGQNLQDTMLIYRINLSGYSVSRYQGNVNDLVATGSLKNIVFWKNTPTKALLIVNNCNLNSSISPNRNNYVTLYTCPLYSQPFTGIIRTNFYNMIASNSWNSNSASLAPNLQKLSNLIISDTQFFYLTQYKMVSFLLLLN